ncbi:MAG TPA: MoaD/ThiS family protein [Candidatus Udaeobacter sp.]|nr:MoaD/ThiS family protein [Candidatus Udaeobacter sp.]
MARVVLIGNLAQVTGGVAEFDLSATSVQQLFRQLGELHPALAPHLESGLAVAIDGQIFQDALLEPIGANSEVFLLPAIAGGAGVRSYIPTFPRAAVATAVPKMSE